MADNKKVDSYGNIEGEPGPYDNYAEALKNLQERDDIETLEDRRARTQGTDFSDAEFVREGKEQGVVTKHTADAKPSNAPKKDSDK